MPEINLEEEKQEAQKRFDALPENLKKELLADKNAQLVFSIGQDYGLDEESIKKIFLLTSEVFLGYIKPEQVASELNKYFGVDLQKSNFIEIELKQKLFNPLKADLEKIYNPPEISIEEETEKSEEEFAPTIIKPFDKAQGGPETEAPATAAITVAPISIANVPILTDQQLTTNDQRQLPQTETNNQELPKKISPLTIGSIPVITDKQLTIPTESRTHDNFVIGANNQRQTINNLRPTTDDKQSFDGVQDKPFIIQTKVEAVKRAMPQFPKETPSINLKVDESILEKPAIKPVSVRLETEQPGDANIRFKMPVITDQRQTTNDKRPMTNDKKPTINNLRPTTNDQQSTIIKKEQPTPVIANQQPTTNDKRQIIEQKPISKLNLSREQPPRVVHYSDFKTPLTNAGTPQKTKPKKEDLINLSTFTKVSGNTVDLRTTTDNLRQTTNNKE